jgi:predicted O-methyltransferase YrrM
MMMSRLQLLFRYLYYIFNAGTRHDVHSPFVYSLLEDVILCKEPYYAYGPVESLRSKLLLDKNLIEVKDLGAGSHKAGSRKRRISDIAATSAKPAKYGQLLFRLVNRFRPRKVLELGTSLGVTTSYLAMAHNAAEIHTIEGSEAVAGQASQNFQRLNIQNIHQHVGNFDDVLKPVLDQMEVLDFVFFDGNHRYEPTVRYFNLCMEHMHEDSVFVFDDIHWSAEMERAWDCVKNDERVRVTIDLFFFGIVFFRKGIERQHFTLRY